MQQTVTTIQGERVLLRPFQEGDAEEAARVWTPELRYMYGGSSIAPRRPAVASQPAAKATVDENEHRFAIETCPEPAERAGGRYIGHVGLRTNDDERSGRYRIGIQNPHYWGKGYGTEVTRLTLRYAFETLDLHRVGLRVTAYNTRARRCYDKCGFRVEGVERQSFQVDGEWQDDILMAILKEEWERQPAEAATTDEVTIRTYRPSDYEQVSAIWCAEWGEGRPMDTPDALDYKLTHDCGPVLVAEMDGAIVGTALGSWDGRWAWVTRLAVHPDHRRCGVARLLMAEVERRLAALGATFTALLVGTGNAGALALYESLGYQRRDDVAFMVKRFVEREEPCCGPQSG